MLRRAPLPSRAPRLAIHPVRAASSHAVAHGHDDHHDHHAEADGPDVHPTLRTIAYHPGTRTHNPPVLSASDASVLPPALKAYIPALPEEEDRPVRTDPRLLPLPGNRFWGVYDHLSAIDPATTRRPIWDVGPTESKRFPDGKVPPLWLIEYGWEKMDEEARGKLGEHLKDRQKGDWRDLSLVEKKAIWHIAYGPWGTRAPVFKHGDGPRLFGMVFWTVAGTVGTYIVFTTWKDRNMKPDKFKTTEYNRKLNHEMRANNVNPITGISSDNYGGTGMIGGHQELGGQTVV